MMREHKRRIRCLVGLLISVGLLVTGCAGAQPGQPASQATQTINTVDGLTGTASFEGYYSGIWFNRWARIEVSIDDGFMVANVDVFLAWIVDTAWSLNNDEPNQGMTFIVRFNDPQAYQLWKADLELAQMPAGLGILSQSDDVALESEVGNGNDFTTFGLNPKTTKNSQFINWPGPVPQTPANTVVRMSNE